MQLSTHKKIKEATMKNRYVLGLVAAIGMVWGTSASAADKGAMPADQQAMMAQMQRYGTPGPNHQILQQAVGRWTHTVRSWMKPGDKAQESQGTSENTLVLNGRFLKQEAHGNWNGQ